MYGLLPILEFFLKNSFLLIPYKKVVSLITGSKSWLLFKMFLLKLIGFLSNQYQLNSFTAVKTELNLFFALSILTDFFIEFKLTNGLVT